MKKSLYPFLILFVLLIVFCISACEPGIAPTSSPTRDQSAITNQPPSVTKPTVLPTPSITWTPTIKPSATLASTQTATLIPSRTPLPTKAIFIQYLTFGGDGGLIEDFYLGRDTPKLVIYTDGQVIMKTKNGTRWYEESALSPQVMCQLRSQIQQTGVFGLKIPLDSWNFPKNPIYKFDNNLNGLNFGEGAPVEIIQIQGDISRTIHIYSPLTDYLVSEVKQTRNLLLNYRPPVSTRLYKPKWAVLFIVQGRNYDTKDLNPENWPFTLPKLSDLWEMRTQSLGFYGGDVVFLDGERLDQMLELFDYQMVNRLFDEDGQEYSLILRPVLPHETVDDISPWPEEKEVELPFQCEE